MRQEPREPQRIISRFWDRIEFAWLCLDIGWDQRFLLVSFFLNGNVYNCCPMPISLLFWGHIYLFSNFMSPQTEKNFAAGWIMCRDSPIPDLDGLR